MGLLEDRVLLITGASGGIGRATALIAAREGARVVLADVEDQEAGDALAQEVVDAGTDALYVQADVSQEPDVENMIEQAVDRFGGINCALNAAGILGEAAPVGEYGLGAWSQVLDINLTGTFLCLKHEIPIMLEQGGGAIVNTSSALGLVALPGSSAYIASKHAIIGLTKAAAVEYSRQGIRVNVVCPGYTDTDMMRAFLEGDPNAVDAVKDSIPLGRFAQAEEIAETVVWMCSERFSYSTGTSVALEGGYVAQ